MASARPICASPASLLERLGDELDGGIRVDRPVRDEQRAGAGIEECAGQAGQRLGTGLSAPPAAVLQADRTTQSASSLRLGNLRGGQQAVVVLGRLFAAASGAAPARP